MRKSILLSFVLCLIFPVLCFSQWGPHRVIHSTRDTVMSLGKNFAVDTFGRIHIVWTQFAIRSPDTLQFCYKRSTDWGNTWEQSVRLISPYMGNGGPSITADGLGNVHLVWNDLLPSGDYVIFYKRSLNGGRTWEPETVLVSSRDTYPNQWGIVADEKGIVHLVWGHPVSFQQLSVGYKRSSDGGATWGPDTMLTNSPMWNQNVSLVLDRKGRPHISWSESGWLRIGRLWYKNAKDEGLNWNPNVMIADSDSTLSWDPNIAVDGMGRVYFFFTAYWGWKRKGTWHRQIVYRVSEDTGKTFGERKALTIFPQKPSEPVVTGDINGGVHLIWNDTIPGRRDPVAVYTGSTDGGRTWLPISKFGDTLPVGQRLLTSDVRGKVHAVYFSGHATLVDTVYYIVYRSGYPLGVEEKQFGSLRVSELTSLEVFPNPATRVANLRFQISDSRLKIPDYKSSNLSIFQSSVSIKIYDVTGRLVRQIPLTLKTDTEVNWDLRDNLGRKVSSGVYFCRLEGEGIKTQIKEVVVLR